MLTTLGCSGAVLQGATLSAVLTAAMGHAPRPAVIPPVGGAVLAALTQDLPRIQARVSVFTGCGTSYFLAKTRACAFNAQGHCAITVPAAEWARRPQAYLADTRDVLVVGLSRSGTTTETVQAITAGRAQGWRILAISSEPGSTILLATDQAVCVPTDPREVIVMSVSASLMLLGGLRMAGTASTNSMVTAASQALAAIDTGADILLPGRSHFVYLGAGQPMASPPKAH